MKIRFGQRAKLHQPHLRALISLITVCFLLNVTNCQDKLPTNPKIPAKAETREIVLTGPKASLAFKNPKDNHHIIELTMEDFDQKVRNGTRTNWLFLFYSPGCQHCVKFAPVYKTVAEELHYEVAGAVNCAMEFELCRRFRIKGYPTIALISKRKMYTYTGSRSIDALIQWVEVDYKQDEFVAAYGSVPTSHEEMKSGLQEFALKVQIAYKINGVGTILFFCLIVILACLVFFIFISILIDIFNLLDSDEDIFEKRNNKKYQRVAETSSRPLSGDDDDSKKTESEEEQSLNKKSSQNSQQLFQGVFEDFK